MLQLWDQGLESTQSLNVLFRLLADFFLKLNSSRNCLYGFLLKRLKWRIFNSSHRRHKYFSSRWFAYDFLFFLILLRNNWHVYHCIHTSFYKDREPHNNMIAWICNSFLPRLRSCGRCFFSRLFLSGIEFWDLEEGIVDCLTRVSPRECLGKCWLTIIYQIMVDNKISSTVSLGPLRKETQYYTYGGIPGRMTGSHPQKMFLGRGLSDASQNSKLATYT